MAISDNTTYGLTGAQIKDLVNGIESKQNALTAGSNIQINNNTISATDTTYTAGTGLDLNGTQFSVDTSVIAEISDIPTKTSDITNDGSDGTSTYVETDELATVATSGSYSDLSNTPTIDSSLSTSSNNAVRNSTISTVLNDNVMTGITVNSTPSTTTVQLDGAKKNLYSGSTTTSSITLPVASTTQAGVMNSSTFDAVTANSNNINALMNGAVAITGLSANPSQSDLTTAWQTETGLSTLINRASIYDVTNQKVWTYYTNDTTWYAASNTSQVVVNTWTNSSEGVILGSTNAGQIFAESDGTGSVNGWDTLTGTVADHTSKLATIAQGAEVNVQANWNETNSSSDAYIQNKPTIPTVNDATLTITQNGTSAGTFTANASSNKTIALTDTTYSNFTGADASTAGAAGLVPAPAAGDQDKVLKGDGTWSTPDSAAPTIYYLDDDVQDATAIYTTSALTTIVSETDLISELKKNRVLLCYNGDTTKYWPISIFDEDTGSGFFIPGELNDPSYGFYYSNGGINWYNIPQYQPKLTAGSNITISGATISATELVAPVKLE